MSGEIKIERERAAGFVESYRRAWEAWDFTGFTDLFSDDVVYVAHATEETVVGRAALAGYIRREADDQGRASVRMGSPVIDGDHVAAEFWVTRTSDGENWTTAVARLLAGRTSLVVAHRMSTIRGAPRVVVLDAGRVVEPGSPAELRAAGRPSPSA